MENKARRTGPATTSAGIGKWSRWAGRALSALPLPIMLYGAGAKLMHGPAIVEGFRKLGLPEGVMAPIGVLEIACVLLYTIPRTAVLGAILVSGYMGGAILTHLRVGEPFVTPLVVGLFVWAGLFLRDERIRMLLPVRS
jgi:hypothetical protein